MKIEKVNLNSKLAMFEEHWAPKVVGALNNQLVKIAKVKGDFIMHNHKDEDELFYVISGKLFIELEDQTIELDSGEFVIIPKGVNHRPFAPEETSIFLFEPEATLNTGDQRSGHTVVDLEII